MPKMYLLGGAEKITPLSWCIAGSWRGPIGLTFLRSDVIFTRVARSQNNTTHHHTHLLSSEVGFRVLQVQAPTRWDVKVCDSDLLASCGPQSSGKRMKAEKGTLKRNAAIITCSYVRLPRHNMFVSSIMD